MSEVKLKPTGGGAGSISLKAPAATTGNADFPLVLPADDGTSSQYLQTNGSGTLTWATVSSVGGATGVDFNDGVYSRWGSGNDLQIIHDGNNSYIQHVAAAAGDLYIQAADDGNIYIKSGNGSSGFENAVVCNDNAEVALYHSGTKKLETTTTGAKITHTGNAALELVGGEGYHAQLYLTADEGDDANDKWLLDGQEGKFVLYNYSNGSSWEKSILANAAGSVELYYDNNKKLETTTGGGTLTGDWFLTTGGYLAFPDGVQAILGTGDDMRIHHTGGVNHVRAANGDLVLGTQTNHMVILGAYYDAAGGGDTIEIWGGSNILPHNNDSIDLGETNHKWDDIYATNSSIQTSDQNTKDNITASDLGLSFINKLSPKSYKFKGKTRTHYGLIAQDIETVLSDISKPTSGFAGFIKTPAPEQLYTERDEAHNRIPSGKAIGDVKLAAHTDYGLRYTEFIGPLVKAVQELSAEVETLKTKVAALEAG